MSILSHSYDYFCNLTLFMIQITVISFIHLDYIILVWVQPKQLLIEFAMSRSASKDLLLSLKLMRCYLWPFPMSKITVPLFSIISPLTSWRKSTVSFCLSCAYNITVRTILSCFKWDSAWLLAGAFEWANNALDFLFISLSLPIPGGSV